MEIETNKEYDKYKKQWEMISTFIDGEEAVKEKGEEYLPSFSLTASSPSMNVPIISHCFLYLSYSLLVLISIPKP
jgi:hypothetical protein